MSNVPETMSAVIADGYGPPEEFSVRRIPVPRPNPGQILVRVEAATVNPLDLHLTRGELRGNIPMEFPMTLGNDFAGTVVETGSEVTRFAEGDEVFGVAFPYATREQVKVFSVPPSVTTGTLAGYAVVEGDSPVIARRPAALDAERAATLPFAGVSALAALRAGRFSAGDTVLVAGATGAVGSIVVPLLAAEKVQVIATAAAGDETYVRDRGAQHVIDYRAQDVAAETVRLRPDGIAGIINLALGADLVPLADQVLAPGGRVVSVAFTTPRDAVYRPDIESHVVFVASEPGDLDTLARHAVDGVVPPVEVRRYPLMDGTKACADLKNEHTRGKLLVLPDH